jgi:hypothetical protein
LNQQAETAAPQMIQLNTSPPPSPPPVRAGQKRKYQGRIDELFLPEQEPNERKISRVVLDSGSDSEVLDNIQLELEPKTKEAQENDSVSDADSDDVIGPRVRRQRHLESSPVTNTLPRSTSSAVESDEELHEEVRDLTSSAKKIHVAQRTRDAKTRNKQKSQFQKNLDNLLKKKQGLESDSDEESVKGRALYDSESDVDSLASDDFIVEDKQELSLEEMMEIPPEFTSVSYQGTQLNFKVVVQGEVFALLHPDYHALNYAGLPFMLKKTHMRYC